MSDEFRKGLEAQSESMHEFKDAPSAASHPGWCSEHGKTGITKACERCDTLFDAGLLGAFNGRFCGLCDMLAEFEAAGIPYRLGMPPIGVSRGS